MSEQHLPPLCRSRVAGWPPPVSQGGTRRTHVAVRCDRRRTVRRKQQKRGEWQHKGSHTAPQSHSYRRQLIKINISLFAELSVANMSPHPTTSIIQIRLASLEPRLSGFFSKLSCETKSGTESLGSRLKASHLAVLAVPILEYV